MPPKRFPKNQHPGKKPPAIRQQPTTNPTNQNLAEAAGTSAAADDETQQRFEEELAWCIHQLKTSLSKNLSGKQEEDVRKSLVTLENPQETMVKKRFVMNKTFGNYRQKMELEKKKIPLDLKNAKIDVVTATSSSFMRKSHLVDSSASNKFSFQKSDNSFRFNFHVDNE